MKVFKIDFSFILMALCFLLSPLQDVFFKILLILFIHEFGHLFFVLIFRFKIRSLRLYALGFLMDVEKENSGFWKELLLYSGGIIWNAVSLLFFPPSWHSYILFILIMNLFPIFPLDGFMILRTICAYILPYRIVLWIVNGIGIIGLSVGSIFLVKEMDYLLFINVVCLWVIGIRNWKNLSHIYSVFCFRRYLYPPSFSYRRIPFCHNPEEYLYKYHRIYFKIEEKEIKEEEILKLKYDPE